MGNFNLNLFKYFYYVVTYNGFTNAAKQLNVAQPSLSLSIKKLEEELSVKLIDRNSKQFNLTDEGYKLFYVIKPVMDSINKNIIFSNDKDSLIEINIGIRFNYAETIMANFLEIFLKSNSHVKINIDLYSKLNFDKVNNKEYDIVIDDNDYIKQLENVDVETICSFKNNFFCSSKVYNEYKNITSIKELDNENFIAFNPSLKNGKFKQFCYNNDVSFIENISINESSIYFKLISDGMGIGFSNELFLSKYLKNNLISIIPIKEQIFEDVFSVAITKQSKEIINFVNCLKNFIMEEVKKYG